MAKKHADLFSPGKARWLLDNAEKLDAGERALLLALAELSQDTGRTLTEEERAALEKLAAPAQGFDPAEIRAAVHTMVESKAARPARKDWAAVSRRLKQARNK